MMIDSYNEKKSVGDYMILSLYNQALKARHNIKDNIIPN